MLGLGVQETSRRIAFINALSGEARSTAISQLSRATGRNEAQVMRALETYNAAVQVGTADGVGGRVDRFVRSESHRFIGVVIGFWESWTESHSALKSATPLFRVSAAAD